MMLEQPCNAVCTESMNYVGMQDGEEVSTAGIFPPLLLLLADGPSDVNDV